MFHLEKVTEYLKTFLFKKREAKQNGKFLILPSQIGIVIHLMTQIGIMETLVLVTITLPNTYHT